MTPVEWWPVTYTRVAHRSRWRVAVPLSLIVGALLVVISGGGYLFAQRAAYDRLETRLEQLALAARYVGKPGGYLVFDEHDHLLSTAPPAISDAGERLQMVSDPVWGQLAVLRLPFTTVGPHMVAIPAGDEVIALATVRRSLIGMTAAGALAALVAGYLLAMLALQPVDNAMQERQEFIALASHQLRTPLSIIRTSTELGRANLGVTSEEALETIAHQAERMERLAARLSELAKAETSARPTTSSADVVAVAADVITSLRPAASRAGVALHLKAPPIQWIRADPADTDDMLSAIVENAIKFSPRGGTVIIRVRPDHRRAVVEVSDQGPGIAPGETAHVVKPFYKGHSSREGYGLGLAIAHAVAERYGGRLSITSALGEGTTVKLDLPVTRQVPVPEPNLEGLSRPKGSSLT